MSSFKPMLAGKAPDDLSLLHYPVLASPKLDGVRVIVVDGVVMSRNLKPIPNQRVQRRWGRTRYNGLDGELIVGTATSPDAFRLTTSGVMSRTGEPDVTFHVFDCYDPRAPFAARLDLARTIVSANQDEPGSLNVVQHQWVDDAEELDHLEQHYLDEGFEGLMIRQPNNIYKHGRSTTAEGGLLKLKRFVDSEAVVVGFEELLHNGNEQTTDALGHKTRSSHKAGKTGIGQLGALVVRAHNVTFNIGTGFTLAERQLLWLDRKSLPGRLVKYKYFPTGGKDKPRFPTFVGWRDPIDA